MPRREHFSCNKFGANSSTFGIVYRFMIMYLFYSTGSMQMLNDPSDFSKTTILLFQKTDSSTAAILL